MFSILVRNERLVISQVGDTQVNCNFINKKGNKIWSFLSVSEYYRSFVGRIAISGFLLVASKHREASFTHSFYLFKLPGYEGFLFEAHVNFGKKKH